MPRRKRSIKRSGYEDQIAKDLDERGIPYRFEPYKLEYFSKVRDVVIECTASNGKCIASKRRWYLPDFVIKRTGEDKLVVHHTNELIIEAKGRFTGPTRTKMLDVKQAHPDLDIRFLVYRKELLRPKLKRTPYNTDWLEANGFDYAVGHEVPKEWL